MGTVTNDAVTERIISATPSKLISENYFYILIIYRDHWLWIQFFLKFSNLTTLQCHPGNSIRLNFDYFNYFYNTSRSLALNLIFWNLTTLQCHPGNSIPLKVENRIGHMQSTAIRICIFLIRNMQMRLAFQVAVQIEFLGIF